MKCPNCNNEIEDSSVFCSFCGSPIVKPEPVAQEEVAPVVEEKVVEPVQETPVVEPVQENTVQQPVQEAAPVADEPIVENVVTEPVQSTVQYQAEAPKTTIAPEAKKAPNGRHSVITMAIIAVVAVLLVGIIVVVLLLCSKGPEKLFKSAINSAIDEMFVGDLTTADSANLSASLELKTNNSELKDYVDGLKVASNLQYDLKAKQVLVGIDLEKGKDAYLNGTFLIDLAEKMAYVQETNLYDKVIKIEIPEEAMDEVNEKLGEDSYSVNKKARKKAAKYIKKAIDENLPKEYFSKETNPVVIDGKTKKVKDNQMKMTMEQFQTAIKNIASSLKMNNDFLNLYEDRDSIVSALDELEDMADEELEGEIVIHLFTTGMSNDFVGFSVVYDPGYGTKASVEIINVKKNEYELNLKTINNSNEEEEIGTAKVTINKNTKNEFDGSFRVDIEDFGYITLNVATSQKYNKGVESSIDTANAVDFEDLSEDDLMGILDNLQNSKLYDVISSMVDLDDYVDTDYDDYDDDDYTTEVNKKLPAGVKLQDNQYYVETYDKDCVIYNVSDKYEMFADDDTWVLYQSKDHKTNLNVVAYVEMEDMDDEVQRSFKVYNNDDTGYYVKAKLSDAEKVKVGKYTFTKRSIVAETKYGDNYYHDFYYTEVGDGNCYYVEVKSSYASVNQSEIEDFLTIEVH